MIRIEKITKIFSAGEVETVALNGLDLKVPQGEFLALMGPSGCGKSTLLNIIGLLDSPTAGKYFLDGEDMSAKSESQRTRIRKGKIGFVFQSFNLIDELTVEENIALPLSYLGIKRAEIRTRVTDLMRRMNISHRASHYPHQLSGGQQQRVAIARAVAGNPAIILADEPTGNLDSRNGVDVMNLLTGLHQQGATIIMATHSARDAQYADRTINLLDGQVIDA